MSNLLPTDYHTLRTADEAGFTAPQEREAYQSALISGLQAANILLAGELAQEHITARTSEVTELPNKRALQERLAELQQSGRIHNYAFLMGDGRNFKAVNDTHDHEVGDDVLRETAYGLIRGLRTIYNPSGDGQDEVYHLSGDEFVALLYKASATKADIDGTRWRVDRSMREVLENDPRLQVLGYGLDVGIADPDEHSTIESLKAAAEKEMKEAKRAGHAKFGQYRKVGAIAAEATQLPTATDKTVAERRRALLSRTYNHPTEVEPSVLDARA